MSDIILKEQESRIIEKTPRKYVKRREGRDGKTFDYVETGYVIQKLNEITNYMWSFEIIGKELVGNNIIVQGKLTLHTKNGNIVKEQFGSSEVKRKRDTKEIIDLADDYKAAASDCLKKCASLVGVALDIYWKQETIEETDQEKEKLLKEIMRSHNNNIKKYVIENNVASNLLYAYVEKTYKKNKIKLLSKEELKDLLKVLNETPDKIYVFKGE